MFHIPSCISVYMFSDFLTVVVFIIWPIIRPLLNCANLPRVQGRLYTGQVKIVYKQLFNSTKGTGQAKPGLSNIRITVVAYIIPTTPSAFFAINGFSVSVRLHLPKLHSSSLTQSFTSTKHYQLSSLPACQIRRRHLEESRRTKPLDRKTFHHETIHTFSRHWSQLSLTAHPGKEYYPSYGSQHLSFRCLSNTQQTPWKITLGPHH